MWKPGSFGTICAVSEILKFNRFNYHLCSWVDYLKGLMSLDKTMFPWLSFLVYSTCTFTIIPQIHKDGSDVLFFYSQARSELLRTGGPNAVGGYVGDYEGPGASHQGRPLTITMF